MKGEIVSFLPREVKIDLGNGSITVSSRKKWTYSEATTQLEKMVKEKQKEEQQTGVATSEDGEPFVTYKAAKE